MPLPSPLLPVSSRPKGGHAGGCGSHLGEAGRQEDPSRLPANDHQAGQWYHRHQQLDGKGGAERHAWTLYIKNICDKQTKKKKNPDTTRKETIQSLTFWRAAIEQTQINFGLSGFSSWIVPHTTPTPTPRQEALVEFTLFIAVDHYQTIKNIFSLLQR